MTPQKDNCGIANCRGIDRIRKNNHPRLLIEVVLDDMRSGGNGVCFLIVQWRATNQNAAAWFDSDAGKVNRIVICVGPASGGMQNLRDQVAVYPGDHDMLPGIAAQYRIKAAHGDRTGGHSRRGDLAARHKGNIRFCLGADRIGEDVAESRLLSRSMDARQWLRGGCQGLIKRGGEPIAPGAIGTQRDGIFRCLQGRL